MPGVQPPQGMEPPGDTQPLSQPAFDLRYQEDGEEDPTLEDFTDVIVFLHPASKEALEAVHTTGLIAPQHLRYNSNLGPLDEVVDRSPIAKIDGTAGGGGENGQLGATQDTQSQDIVKTVRMDNALALRFSSRVNDPAMGFKFGRNDNCDVFIRPNRKKAKISGLHFRIYVTDDGVVMIQDCSTNGTWVDNTILRTQQQHVLYQGATIEVITWTDSQKSCTERASFTVTFPKYEDPMQQARHRLKLETYLLQRARQIHGQLSNGLPASRIPRLGGTIASDRDLSCGMHWTGAPTYSVQKKLGGGAFATVYLLVTRNGGNVFAAKEIQKKNVNTQDLDIKISTEISIMKKVTHPHVVELFDWVDKGTHLYLIMEYMPCGDLGKFTSEAHPLGEPSAQIVSKQVCHALRYIHSLNITHRDIKPDNILVLSWEPLWVKLSDFGLSKMIERDGGAAAMRTFCGTMLYCAPEVFPEYTKLVNAPPSAATAARYDSKVDIWSLGSVFYQLLLHEPAYRNDRDVSAQAMPSHFLRVLLNTKPNLDPKRQPISYEAARFLQACLQTDPTSRPDARGCLEHDWLANVKDVTTELPTPLDEDVSELSKSTQELLELTEAAERLKSTPLPSEISASQLDSGSEIDSTHLEAFLDYRRTSPISDGEAHELPQKTSNQPRPTLFGEVAPTGVVDSGVFGRNEVPHIHSDFVSSDGITPEPADGQDNATAMHSTVSNVQDLTISSPSAPPSAVLLDATTMPPPPQPSALKRHREDEPQDSLLTTSKRLMARESPKPKPKPVFGKLIPVPGSTEEAEELVLRGPVSAWGRHHALSHKWPRADDTRIPKTGMDIVFWSPAMADYAAQRSIDWVNVDLAYQRGMLDEGILSGLECYLKTRSSLGISVNGVPLHRTAEHDWRVVHLRHGDEIEIFRGAKGFLCYKCELYVGLASKQRRKDAQTTVTTCSDLQAWSEKILELNNAKASALG